jgi:L,D-transpeptidase ErfK/SrfK
MKLWFFSCHLLAWLSILNGAPLQRLDLTESPQELHIDLSSPQKLLIQQSELLKKLQHLNPLDDRQNVLRNIKDIGSALFFTPIGLGHTLRETMVKKGDSLSVIAKRHHISRERISLLNPELKQPDRIFPNMKLRISDQPCKVIIYKKRFEMECYLGDVLFRVYPVGLGAEGRDTPVGKTTVSTSRAKNPNYTDRATNITYPYGDPMHTVGSRWIGLSMGNGYGIHGTNDPDSIGKSMSKGCIRMKRNDLEELYDLVLPGNMVIIEP